MKVFMKVWPLSWSLQRDSWSMAVFFSYTSIFLDDRRKEFQNQGLRERDKDKARMKSNSCELYQKALPKSCMIFPESQSANSPLERTSRCQLICKILHECCMLSLHNCFVYTYGTHYFGNIPLCIH